MLFLLVSIAILIGLAVFVQSTKSERRELRFEMEAAPSQEPTASPSLANRVFRLENFVAPSAEPTASPSAGDKPTRGNTALADQTYGDVLASFYDPG